MVVKWPTPSIVRFKGNSGVGNLNAMYLTNYNFLFTQVMDRGWNQNDGQGVYTYKRNNGPPQLFINSKDALHLDVLGIA